MQVVFKASSLQGHAYEAFRHSYESSASRRKPANLHSMAMNVILWQEQTQIEIKQVLEEIGRVEALSKGFSQEPLDYKTSNPGHPVP